MEIIKAITIPAAILVSLLLACVVLALIAILLPETRPFFAQAWRSVKGEAKAILSPRKSISSSGMPLVQSIG